MKDYKEDLQEIDKSRKLGDNSILNIFALAVSPISFPLALGIMVFDMYEAIKENTEELKNPVPDNWLEKISKDESVSNEGLNFLAKKLELQGYVSIRDAYEWLNLEEKIANKKLEELKYKENLNKDGAINLLNRVKNIKGNTISFEKAFEQINKVKEKFDFTKEINMVKNIKNITDLFNKNKPKNM